MTCIRWEQPYNTFTSDNCRMFDRCSLATSPHRHLARRLPNAAHILGQEPVVSRGLGFAAAVDNGTLSGYVHITNNILSRVL